MRALAAFRSSGPLWLAALLLGCATEWPSRELFEARDAYRQAEVSRAASFSRDRLADAKKALERAEGANEAAPGTPEARALAYVALRRAELAKVSGDYEFDRYVIAQLRERKRRGETQVASTTSTSPQSAEVQTPPAADDATQGGEQILASLQAITAVTDALSGLEPLVTTKKTDDGLSIRLDSSFLFEPKTANVLPGAHEKLDRVAKALGELGEDETIVVKGHTDATGDDARNLELSKKRADAVKDYLVSRGVAPERVRAEGRGKQEPMAPNDTAEGRAQNRRVEITVMKKETP
jgi:outer membrane protein OmpA-like peptidoglycan-associated protein